MAVNKGFTLIELMVVIGIIAILATIGLTIYTSAQKSGRDGRRIADIQEIQKALEQFYAANGYYPIGSGSNGTVWAYNVTTFNNDLTPYFQGQKIPQDPQASATRDYVYASNNVVASCTNYTYVLCAQLEACGTKCNRGTVGTVPGTGLDGCGPIADSGVGSPPTWNYYCVGALSQ